MSRFLPWWPLPHQRPRRGFDTIRTRALDHCGVASMLLASGQGTLHPASWSSWIFVAFGTLKLRISTMFGHFQNILSLIDVMIINDVGPKRLILWRLGRDDQRQHCGDHSCVEYPQNLVWFCRLPVGQRTGSKSLLVDITQIGMFQILDILVR